MITPQQITFMEQNRPHYDTLIRAQFLTNIGYDIKEGMLNMARTFAPAYQANLWCSPCVCELVKFAYIQFDKWIVDNPIMAYSPQLEIEDTEVKVKRKYTRKA